MVCLCPKTHKRELPSPPAQDGPPNTGLPTLSVLPTVFGSPHLTPLTSSTWAWVCCSRLLLVRFGGGPGGPPSPAGAAGGAVAAVADLRGRDGFRPRAWSLRPRSQDSAHPPVHPTVPPFLLFEREASRWEPGFHLAPPPKSCHDLEWGPFPPPGLSFPACQMRATSQTWSRVDPK